MFHIQYFIPDKLCKFVFVDYCTVVSFLIISPITIKCPSQSHLVFLPRFFPLIFILHLNPSSHILLFSKCIISLLFIFIFCGKTCSFWPNMFWQPNLRVFVSIMTIYPIYFCHYNKYYPCHLNSCFLFFILHCYLLYFLSCAVWIILTLLLYLSVFQRLLYHVNFSSAD